MKLLTLNKDIRIYSRFAKEKQGLNMIKHLCDLKYSGKANIKGDFF
jgi:hypothetical protein